MILQFWPTDRLRDVGAPPCMELSMTYTRFDRIRHLAQEIGPLFGLRSWAFLFQRESRAEEARAEEHRGVLLALAVDGVLCHE